MGVIGGWGYFKRDGGISTFSEVLKISTKFTYRGHKGFIMVHTDLISKKLHINLHLMVTNGWNDIKLNHQEGQWKDSPELGLLTNKS